ncbi:MAG TPA: NAD(P)(+) transhydrogenase (Re/Si-specific) subunit beta [Nitrospiria bacterium]|nr:NAD(P)(+) transhydrogenase (Re/Si-specific) subunit beta [Nitrospiria bacterium]
MTSGGFIQWAYLIASILFILGLKDLNSARTARRGMFLAEFGMALAIVGTLFHHEIISYQWIIVGMVVGSAIGTGIALWTPMTAMPQRTALSHAFGALAVTLVGISEYHRHGSELGSIKMTAIGFEVMMGALTVTGSLMAFAKLQELITAQIAFRGQIASNVALFGGMVGIWFFLIAVPATGPLFYLLVGLALVFGILLVLPIGAADMPVVISLLNSYAGLAAAATGFVISNEILIIAGTLDGASGFVLSILMCKAMNRSLTNVLFGGMGIAPTSGPTADQVYGGKVKAATAEEIAMVLETARSVVIVPGYGMAVSQAQHAVRDLAILLESRGAEVAFAIHPVAGRMPGHMNVLLAEADIPYDKLKEMDEINPVFEQTDVALVIGANDVVNPVARTDPSSPIAGMPILDVDKAKTVVVIKRSLSPGFAGIPNPLFAADNTLMYFADGKKAILDLISALKAA